MLSSTEIFNKFCKHVDETIFSEENVGSYVAFVVDQSFVVDFCNVHSIKEIDLMKSVRCSLYRRDLLSIKGILVSSYMQPQNVQTVMVLRKRTIASVYHRFLIGILTICSLG